MHNANCGLSFSLYIRLDQLCRKANSNGFATDLAEVFVCTYLALIEGTRNYKAGSRTVLSMYIWSLLNDDKAEKRQILEDMQEFVKGGGLSELRHSTLSARCLQQVRRRVRQLSDEP